MHQLHCTWKITFLLWGICDTLTQWTRLIIIVHCITYSMQPLIALDSKETYLSLSRLHSHIFYYMHYNLLWSLILLSCKYIAEEKVVWFISTGPGFCDLMTIEAGCLVTWPFHASDYNKLSIKCKPSIKLIIIYLLILYDM